ncbi:hypothetical protein B0H34DRAFT_662866 [Crassisporium funariophilum]|nr:hypothetical protein B0H34DRAFT_662866 [Crassisporium funariophilum]
MTPIETLPAIRAALFVKNLSQIDYYFNPDFDRMIDEVNDLCGLIARLPSIDNVRLYFDVIDQWISGSRMPSARLNPKSWKRQLTRLLEIILDKSCTQLNLIGGMRFSQVYLPDNDTSLADNVVQPQRTNSRLSRTKSVYCQRLRSFGKTSKPNEGKTCGNFSKSRKNILPGATNTASTSNVTSLTRGDQGRVCGKVIKEARFLPSIQIHSDMLLQVPFQAWTLETLQISSSSITILSLISGSTPSVSWKNLLRSIFLPNLVELELCANLARLTKGAKFEDLEDFFDRHSTIQTLQLFGVELPDFSTSPNLPSLSHSVTLPNLVRVTAHPAYVEWILRAVSLDENALPDLVSISIASDYYWTSIPFNYDTFDSALALIAVFPRDVTLGLRFFSQPEQGIQAWFEKQVQEANRGNGRPHASNRIIKIVISGAWYVPLDKDMLVAIAQWLREFPQLVQLEFKEQPQDFREALKQAGFVEEVTKTCPKLQGFIFNGVQHTWDSWLRGGFII